MTPPGPNRSGYLAVDTIAALATAVGGAVSIVRVSGPRAFAALARLAAAGGSAEAAQEDRRLSRVKLCDLTGAPLDDALAVRFTAPASFTGEDVVELHLHGGAYVARRVLECLQQLGARPALPGEFSFRAVRGGKLNLSQAEAIADLVAAPNDRALALALEKLGGALSGALAEVAAGLRELAVLAEAGIDFADQDLDEVSLRALQARLTGPVTALRALGASFARGTRIQEGLSVSFIGRPNAGKSSLFNALLGEDRSIVSELAGTTRDVVRERLTLRGSSGAVTLRLEDTAGLRVADEPVERMGVERSLRSAREAELLLLIVDASAVEAEREELARHWERLGRPAEKTLGILTKCDLRPGVATGPAELGILRWFRTSAVSGEGVAEAARGIADFCERWVTRAPGEILLTRLEERAAVEAALANLEAAEKATEIDLFAADLRHALGALGPLIGETLPDDILGQIFSKFCIGK